MYEFKNLLRVPLRFSLPCVAEPHILSTRCEWAAPELGIHEISIHDKLYYAEIRVVVN